MLVAIEAEQQLTLIASSLDDHVSVGAAALGSGQAVRVVALVYREDLDALGLSAGPVPLASAGEDARALPAGASIYEVRLPTEGAAWTQAQSLGPALTAARLPAISTPCREFDVRIHRAPTAAHSTYLLPLAAREALAATRDERFFRFDLDGGVTEIVPETIGPPALAAVVDGDGLWLSGAGGAISEAHVNGTLLRHTPVTTAPGGGLVRWIAGGATPSGPELVTLTENGRLSRWDGRSWTRLTEPSEVPAGDLGFGAIAQLGPGEFVAVRGYWANVVRVRDGVATIESLPPGQGAPHAVAAVPDVGTVVATSEGQFIRHDGEEWRVLSGSPLRTWGLAVLPYGRGFVYTGAFGNFGQYVEGHGFCPLSQLTAFDVDHIVRFGDQLMLFGENPNTAETPFAVLTPL